MSSSWSLESLLDPQAALWAGLGQSRQTRRLGFIPICARLWSGHHIIDQLTRTAFRSAVSFPQRDFSSAHDLTAFLLLCRYAEHPLATTVGLRCAGLLPLKPGAPRKEFAIIDNTNGVDSTTGAAQEDVPKQRSQEQLHVSFGRSVGVSA